MATKFHRISNAIEVKVSLINEPWGWDNKATNCTYPIETEKQYNRLISDLKKWSNTAFVREIRWNWLGSSQGHYLLNTYSDNRQKENEKDLVLD